MRIAKRSPYTGLIESRSRFLRHDGLKHAEIILQPLWREDSTTSNGCVARSTCCMMEAEFFRSRMSDRRRRRRNRPSLQTPVVA
jgi:hypothetical protein